MTDFRDASWWDVSSEDYYSSTLPGYSYLSRLLTDKDPPKKTVGDFGNAVHVGVLQPERFGDLVMVKPSDVDMPKAGSTLRDFVEAIVADKMSHGDLVVLPDGCGGNSKVAREKKAAFLADLGDRFVVDHDERERVLRCVDWLRESAGKYVVSEEQHHLCMALCVGVTEHPATQRLWSHPKSRPEQAVRGTDSVTGIECRTRLDHFVGGKGAWLCTDLKTADDPDPETSFFWHAFEYGYHIQAALCCDLVEAIPEVGMCPAFNWLVVGNRLPVRIAWVQCTEEWLDLGRRDLRSALTLEAARREREWPRVPRHYEGRALQMQSPAKSMVEAVERREEYARKVAGR